MSVEEDSEPFCVYGNAENGGSLRPKGGDTVDERAKDVEIYIYNLSKDQANERSERSHHGERLNPAGSVCREQLEIGYVDLIGRNEGGRTVARKSIRVYIRAMCFRYLANVDVEVVRCHLRRCKRWLIHVL